MTFSPLAFAFQVANFLVLVWILKRWLYRPFLDAIDARRAEMQAGRDAVARSLAEAAAATAAAETARRNIENSREADLAAARADALAERNRIIDSARTEAQTRIEAAEARIAAERSTAIQTVRVEAAAIGIDLAGKVLHALPQAALDRGFADAVDAWFDTADEPHRKSLFGIGGTVRVSTAAPLAVTMQQVWTDLVRRRSAGASSVSFAVDAEIGPGVEIELPGGNLRFSLRSAAEEVRKATSHV